MDVGLLQHPRFSPRQYGQGDMFPLLILVIQVDQAPGDLPRPSASWFAARWMSAVVTACAGQLIELGARRFVSVLATWRCMAKPDAPASTMTQEDRLRLRIRNGCSSAGSALNPDMTCTVPNESPAAGCLAINCANWLKWVDFGLRGCAPFLRAEPALRPARRPLMAGLN